MEPVAELLEFPKEYGTPTDPLDWGAVRSDLESAERYWIATIRPDGRPHAVPVDGLWVDDAWYYGGSDETVHIRSVRANPQIVMHLEDGLKVVIVEGEVLKAKPEPKLAKRLAEASRKKYGYGQSASDYEKGVLALRPRRVLAWTSFPKDATRFVFDGR